MLQFSLDQNVWKGLEESFPSLISLITQLLKNSIISFQICHVRFRVVVLRYHRNDIHYLFLWRVCWG